MRRGAALALDLRTVGESGGTPRRLENPRMKNEDVVSALDHLLTRQDIDRTRVFLWVFAREAPRCSTSLHPMLELPLLHRLPDIIVTVKLICY